MNSCTMHKTKGEYMKLNDVYDYYGGNWAFAMRQLCMARCSYSYWLNIKCIPYSTQLKIQLATNGKLKAERYVD